MTSTENTSGPAPQRKEKCMLQCTLSLKEDKSSCFPPFSSTSFIFSYAHSVINSTWSLNVYEMVKIASEQSSSGPEPQFLALGYISSGLMQNLVSSSLVISPLLPAAAQLSTDTTDTLSSTTIVQDVPSVSTSPTTHEIQSLVIHQGVEEQIQGFQNDQFDNEPLLHNLTPDLSSEESSSQGVIPSNLHQLNQLFDNLSKWSKDYPLENVIGNPSRPVLTKRQLQTHVIWCYFDAHGHPIPFGGKRSG
ncbi:hypothetical protein Tco_0846226 [Tanacetum coccineum]